MYINVNSNKKLIREAGRQKYPLFRGHVPNQGGGVDPPPPLKYQDIMQKILMKHIKHCCSLGSKLKVLQ